MTNQTIESEQLVAREKISNLKDGEVWIWPESDYGRAEIWQKHGMLFLFAIPHYGGERLFHNSYTRHQIDELVQIVGSWT